MSESDDMEQGFHALGVELDTVEDLKETYGWMESSGFSQLVIPLAHPRYRRVLERSRPFTRSDTLLSSARWGRVLGKLSPWIRLEAAADGDSGGGRHLDAWHEEASWACHLGLAAVVVELPWHCDVLHLASALTALLLRSSFMHVLVQVSVHSRADDVAQAHGREVGTSASAWHRWSRLHAACDYHARLGVALVLDERPSCAVPEQELARWFGEPIRAVFVPVAAFGKVDDPVHLETGVRRVCTRMKELQASFYLSGGGHERGRLVECAQELGYVLAESEPEMTEAEMFEQPYRDFLQHPLQPLMDNLESATYETFERDPVKYRLYRRAIAAALADLSPPQQDEPSSSASSSSLVVMVVGAGRGPLVRAVLAGAKQIQRKVRVYAVEKNPNALVTLRTLAETEWEGQVTVVGGDMRFWHAPEMADVLVSELLGSFGDNELSPECIDGAQRYLKPSGISIPAQYTSFLSPTMTPKLHNLIRAYNDVKHFEIPYVVKLFNCYQLAAPKPVFTFAHPNRAERIDNRRHTSLTFVADADAVVHGLTGYFDCVLYRDIRMSILPSNHSEDMVSWFPIFFPLRSPIHVRKGDSIDVHIWRMASLSKVWYEWCVAGPDISPIHNPAARSYFIGTSS